MKKVTAGIICGFAFVVVCAFGVAAQTPTAPATKPVPSQSKPAPKSKVMPKTDAEIEQCIKDRLAKAPKLKDQGFSVSVTGGVATFTGTAKNSGSKGGVSGIAKACNAAKVVNNITVPAKTTKPKTSTSKTTPKT